MGDSLSYPPPTDDRARRPVWTGARVYDQLAEWSERGPSYIAAAILVTFLLTELFLLPMLAVVTAGYLNLSLAEVSLTMAVFVSVTALGVGVFLLIERERFAVAAEWLANRDPALAPRARVATYEIPRKIVTVGVPIGMAVTIPAATAALAIISGYSTTLDIIEFACYSLAAGVAGALSIRYLGELTLLPIRASLGSRTESEVRREGLAWRMLTAVLMVTFVAATFAGFWGADRAADGAGQLLEAIVAALVVTAVLATIVAPLIAGGLVAPLLELIRGTKAVGSGDLDTQVAVTSADELGDLAISFNEMVADLRGYAEELTRSRARIVTAGDESRRRVERDLHDGAQQSLVLLNLKLELARKRLADRPEVVDGLLTEAGTELDRALAELRDLAHGIYPQVLTTDGLATALSEVAAAAPIPVEVWLDGTTRYPPEIEAAVYFCCLEALQNAGKHAGTGAKVKLRMEQREGQLEFEVSDDGAGFDLASKNGSAGLQNMADRIGALGGELSIDSIPGGGTRVSGSVPVEG